MADYTDFNRTLVRGRAALLSFRVKRRDTLGYADITGYTAFRFTGKLGAEDADAAEVFTKTLGVGIAKTDATNGLLSVTLSGSELTALSAGKEALLKGELQCVADDGLPYSLARGLLSVEPEISRTTP